MNAWRILAHARAAGLLRPHGGRWMRIAYTDADDESLDFLSDRGAIAARIGRALLRRGVLVREEYARDVADRVLAEEGSKDWLETRASLTRLGQSASRFMREVLRDERETK